MFSQSSTLITFLSASALPLLALLGILLRRNLFQGKMKLVLLVAGFLLLSYAVFAAFVEHGEELGLTDIFVGGITALITLFILSRFNHGHRHAKEEGGAKGIVISEAFHSLIDGAVIGATFLVNPLLGGAATLGILIHEFPKIIGTLAIFRGLGLSARQTVLYGILAQIGSPVAAVFVFMLGKQFDTEKLHALEIASISSLGAIVLWIIWLEIKYHKKHDHHER
jgi:zinc and cadmium transporter